MKLSFSLKVFIFGFYLIYLFSFLVQLLNSKTAVFDFSNFKDTCSSVMSFNDKQIIFICALKAVIKCGGKTNVSNDGIVPK